MLNKIALFFLDDDNQNKMIPFLSILLGFIIGGLLLIIFKYNPVEAYQKLIEGGFGKFSEGEFGDMRRIGQTLLSTTGLILTGLSVAFAFRTGMFNIGASGQLLMGGFVATLIGVVLELPKIIHLPLALLGAIVAGALWAYLPALLKAKFRIHEVVTTIMMNWIAVWTVYYFVPILIPGHYDTESAIIKPTASLRVEWLTEMFDKSFVNLGIFIAIIAAVIIWFVLDRTTFGYELKAVGYNKDAAKYAGIKVDRNIIFSMMISGALAGLAGATYYLGYSQNLKIGELPSLGFDGIAVSLLALNTPLGVLLSGALFGFMNAAKSFMTASTDVPNELVPIIMAIIIYFAATNLMIKSWIKKLGQLLFRQPKKAIQQTVDDVDSIKKEDSVEKKEIDNKKGGDK
ncbi:MAG: ABC transporter permease [Vallitaleaceae bacterium]|jgi:ABC-type uncharacterized transport system permease subunit|nr:ABC transporter permease [Vallitaleaceae bacterium]